jgi:hypothetical protein
MLTTAFIQLFIALFILIWAAKISDRKERRLIEFGVFLQFLLSIGLVTIYLLY